MSRPETSATLLPLMTITWLVPVRVELLVKVFWDSRFYAEQHPVGEGCKGFRQMAIE